MISDINGHRVNVTDSTIDVAGLRLVGGSALKHSEKQEPGEVEGASSIPVGWTNGPWSGDGGFSLPWVEALQLAKQLGGLGSAGFFSTVFSSSWTLAALDSSDGIATLTINAARLTGTDLDLGDRSKPTMVAFTFKLLQPSSWDGAMGALSPDHAGSATGFLLSVFGS